MKRQVPISVAVFPRRKYLNPADLELFAHRAVAAMKLATGGIGILVTGNEELKRLNRRFRGKARSTDVLSFPAPWFPAKSGVPYVHLGDIAISAEMAAQSARKYGHTLVEEIKVLIVHGILHLNGYDHESDSGEMERHENELRRKLALPTSLIHRVTANEMNDLKPKMKRKVGLKKVLKAKITRTKTTAKRRSR